ncbi:hypothetical protein K457DRAFT_752134 [Linnemannia elongata AG-77]|uniref:Ribosomal eL28/Mak16 domain-containing protein n=1 Tax=Linnemannia elongata AG-77 TaxID=1314771 RepID=A0A197JMW1_9FUNG|nr:hypothetical protein K457DRAFT_752134 [Linnemannia elongata AG-77]
MSADLTWLLIKNNNSFLVKRSGVQFSSEAGNLLNKNSFKFSGIANKKTIDIAAAASGRGVVVSTPKTKVTLTKGIRKSARSVAGLTRAGYRADLRQVRTTLSVTVSFSFQCPPFLQQSARTQQIPFNMKAGRTLFARLQISSALSRKGEDLANVLQLIKQ